MKKISALLVSAILLGSCGGSSEPTELPSYAINLQIQGSGDVTPANLTFKSGNVATISLSPSEGFEITSVSGCEGKLLGNIYTTNPISKSCTVYIIFSKISLFAASLELPSLGSEYRLCDGNYPHVQSIALANLSGHTDNKKDIVLTMWCGVKGGTVYLGPIPNYAVFYKQDKNGSFSNSTESMFGVRGLDQGGVAWKPIVHDFNKDNFDELIYPVLGEDGRADHPGYTVDRPSSFITSVGGQFKHEFKGPSFGHISKIKISSNNEILVTGNRYWSYNNGWQEHKGYNWYHLGMVFYIKDSIDKIPNYATVPRGPRLELWAKSINNNIKNIANCIYCNGDDWVEIDNFVFPSKSVPIISWRKEQSYVDMITIDGKQYIYPLMEKMCELKVYPNEKSHTFIAFSTLKLDNSYQDGTTLEEGKNMSNAMIPLLFDYKNNKLERTNIIINNWVEKLSPYDLECEDVNNDNYEDIVLIPGSANGINGDTKGRGKPFIYLNNQNGTFSLVNHNNFPEAPSTYFDTTSVFKDIDGDGIRDFVFYPLSYKISSTELAKFYVYKGKRHLNKLDLQ